MFFDHYPYTNFHNVNLDWVLQAVKAWGQTVEANDRAFRDLKEANEDFKEYVRNYLQDLDITDEINTKLDNMLASGILTPYFAPYVKGYVDSWLASHVTPTSPALDSTLTLSGAAARADSTGKRLKDLAYIDALSTPEIIAALNRSQVLPGYRVQGIAYDYNGHYYVCGGSVDETGTGVIVKMTKPDFTDAEITEIPQLGHANDITYYDGYLYVCTVGGGDAPQWGIYKINVNDFTDKTLISNAPENTIGISYRQGDFWILAPYRIYRTKDFTSYEVVVANTNDLLTAYGIPTSGRISQTIFRTAGYLIGWVCSFVFEDRHYGALTFFNSAGEAIAFKMFPAYHTEIQGAVYADMSIYLVSDGNMINVFRMDPRHLSYVQLKAGDDLNSFTGRGTLYSTGSNVSAALLNSPSAGEGFTVQVDRLGVYNTIQTARTNSGREMYRIKSFNSDTWGEWIEPAAEVAEIKEDLSVKLNNSLDLMYKENFSPTWEQGLINNNTGGNAPKTDYIRTKYFRVTNALHVTVAEGYLARIAIYREMPEGTTPQAAFLGWLDSTEWTGEKTYNYPNGYLCRIRLRRNPIEDLLPTEGAESVTVDRIMTDNTLSQEYAPADAYKTGVEIAKRLNVGDLIAINENDDLNNYTTIGLYRSNSTAITSTLSNCPITDTGFLLVVLKTNTAGYREQILSVNNYKANRIYKRIKTIEWGAWDSLVEMSDIRGPKFLIPNANQLPSMSTNPVKTSITVATYNVRHYEKDNGIKIGYDPIYIDRLRAFLLSEKIDILFLQESEDTIDTERELNAFDYLYKYFFTSDRNVDPDPTDRLTSSGRRKCLTRLNFSGDGTEMTSVVVPWTYSENMNGYYSWCIATLPDIGRFLLIDVHNFAHEYAEQSANRTRLLNMVQTLINNEQGNYDYYILGGDFNTTLPDDKENLLTFCNNINGSPVNGGILGWFGTQGAGVLKELDNIIVSSNINIESIRCFPFWKETLSSDHIPVVARINLT